MNLNSSFMQEIASALRESSIDTSEDGLRRASHDETHGLNPSMPLAVLFPECHDDVVKLARACSKFDIGMTPRGAGTGKSGGCVPLNGSIVIDFSRMNKIVSVNRDDFTVVVEPGVVLGDLQSYLETFDLYYPPDPASSEWCTIGGNISENASGPSAVKYGVTRDYVLGMRIVTASGETHLLGKRTIKGVTGLDLTALMCGSEGCLALLTQATLRVLPKPKKQLAAWFNFASRQSALSSVSIIRSFGIKCIEFVDQTTLDVALGVGYKQRWLAEAKALLLVELDGDDSEVLLARLKNIDQSLNSSQYLGASIAADENQRQEIWRTRKGLSEAVKKSKKHKISEDVVVPLSELNNFLNQVEAICEKYQITTCSFGHAGDGNLHLQFLFDTDPKVLPIDQMLGEVFLATVSSGGTLTGEHGVGIAKKAFLGLEQDESLIALQKAIKKVFDPKGILNPGKFI